MNKQIIYKNIFNYKFMFGLFISLFFSYISFNQFNFKNLLKLINEIKYLYIFVYIYKNENSVLPIKIKLDKYELQQVNNH